jgi:hypothetical protein
MVGKALKYTVVIALGLPIALLTTIWLLNAFDADLNSEVASLVKRAEAEHIAQEGNSYFPMRGLHVPPGQHIEAAGRALHASDQHEAEVAKSDDGRGGSLPDPPGTLRFQGETLNLCTTIDDSLYEGDVCKFQADTDRMFRENSELLRRYYDLISYKTYEEPARTFASPDSDLVSLMRLANVDMERKLDSGQPAEAAALIAQNLAFWRRALDGRYRLITEAVFRVNYSYSLLTLSQLLWRHPELARSADLRAAVGEPVNAHPDRLQAQMDREFMGVYLAKRGSDLLFPDWPGSKTHPVLKRVADRLYQRNATLNGYYACLATYYAVRRLRGIEHQRAVSQYRDYDIDWGLGVLINPTGKLALREICPKRYWFDTLGSSDVLEARRRLVLLEMRLLGTGVPPSNYPALLLSAGSALHDPVTGKPAKWDAERNIIYYQRDEGCIEGRLWVRLGRGSNFAECPS